MTWTSKGNWYENYTTFIQASPAGAHPDLVQRLTTWTTFEKLSNRSIFMWKNTLVPVISCSKFQLHHLSCLMSFPFMDHLFRPRCHFLGRLRYIHPLWVVWCSLQSYIKLYVQDWQKRGFYLKGIDEPTLFFSMGNFIGVARKQSALLHHNI